MSLEGISHGAPGTGPVRILQFGAGNFLRAFVDWMVLRMRQAGVFDGMVAVVQAVPEPLPEAFRRQGNAYTVVLRGLEQGRPVERIERVDVISRRFEPYLDYPSYLEAAANPDLRVVVSNTTEAGIAPSPEDRAEDRPGPVLPGQAGPVPAGPATWPWGPGARFRPPGAVLRTDRGPTAGPSGSWCWATAGRCTGIPLSSSG